MVLLSGDSYDTTIIRREKTRNGFKNIKDKAAIIEDSDTGEKQLKMKSDGLIVPKPSNQEFGTLWYRDFLDKLTRTKSHCDFIEVYLKDDDEGDFVSFQPESEELVLNGNEGQFQTHRDLENEKTLDLFSEDGNQELYFLAGLGVITMINLGGMYVIVNGLDQAIVSGVKEGFQTVQSQAQQAGEVTGNWILLTVGFSHLIQGIRQKIGDSFDDQ